jgi:hypothetical protein
MQADLFYYKRRCYYKWSEAYWNARNVIVSENEGKSRYYAMSLNYQKTRGSDDYSYRLNYTLSSSKNDGRNF